MTLYHFTAEHLARRIEREGITMGAITLFDSAGRVTGIERGWIWLTTDPVAVRQTWNTRIMIPYDRCAVMFEVEIPDSSAHNLNPAIQVIHDQFPNSECLLNWPGSRNWYLYHGKVFRKWIRNVEVKDAVC